MPDDVFTRSARALNRDISHYITSDTSGKVRTALEHSANVLEFLLNFGKLSNREANAAREAIKMNRDAMKLLE